MTPLTTETVCTKNEGFDMTLGETSIWVHSERPASGYIM